MTDEVVRKGVTVHTETASTFCIKYVRIRSILFNFHRRMASNAKVCRTYHAKLDLTPCLSIRTNQYEHGSSIFSRFFAPEMYEISFGGSISASSASWYFLAGEPELC